MYVPVIDVSEHQSTINFAKMHEAGVEGVIIRVCHGQKIDDRFEHNWEVANQHFPGNVGVYPFVNPKRGSPLACATFLESCVRNKRVPFIMFDVEDYQYESPNVGVIWTADQFRPWLREHVAAVRRLLPDVKLIGYSNASFWNPNVNDPQLAASLEWIVPRYPIYSLNGYALHPLPGVDGWEAWAFRVGPLGPFPPKGASGWEGWQFSAGYNQQGPRYGCQSQDLDLNIVRPDAWARWTQSVPPPEPTPPTNEEDMKALLYTVSDGIWFLLDSSGTARQVRNGNEYKNWQTAGAVLANAESVGHFEQMLTTYQPVGALTPAAAAVLSDAAVADWKARVGVNVTVNVPPIQVPDLNFSGIISS